MFIERVTPIHLYRHLPLVTRLADVGLSSQCQDSRPYMLFTLGFDWYQIDMKTTFSVLLNGKETILSLFDPLTCNKVAPPFVPIVFLRQVKCLISTLLEDFIWVFIFWLVDPFNMFVINCNFV